MSAVELTTAFRRDGFVCAGPVLDDEVVTTLRSAAARLISRFTEDGYRADDYWHYDVDGSESPVLYRIHNLEKQDFPEADLLHRPELARLAASLVGDPVEATAFALVLKEPVRAGGVPWHRDRTNVKPHTVCNLSICLDSADQDNGCLEGVAGSHLLPDDADVDAVRDAGPRTPVEVRAGDLVAHDVRLVHGSGVNPTERWRRTIVIEFADPALRLR